MESVTTIGAVQVGMQMIQQLGQAIGGRWMVGMPDRQGTLLYEYHVNHLKSVLFVNTTFYDQVTELFTDTDLRMYKNSVQNWCRYPWIHPELHWTKLLRRREEVESFCNFAESQQSLAKSQPQAASTAYTHGPKNKWSFLCCAMSDAATALVPVERILTEKLTLTITGCLVNTEEWTILASPCRYGGFGLVNPTELSTHYQSSQQSPKLSRPTSSNKSMPLGMPSRMCAQLRRKWKQLLL